MLQITSFVGACALAVTLVACGQPSQTDAPASKKSNANTEETSPPSPPPAAAAGTNKLQQSFVSSLDLTTLGCDATRALRTLGQCKACHSFEPDKAHSTGPNLFGIVGRPVAQAEGFRYSPVLMELGGDWSLERLDAFLEIPQKYAPRNRMAYGGVRNDMNREALLCLLRELK